MGYLHRHGPAGLIAVVLGVWLSLSACTGGTAAAPTSETPLTPRGSLVDETPSAASSEASRSPAPPSMLGSRTTKLSSKSSSVQSTTTTTSRRAAPSPRTSPSADPTVSESSISAPSTARSATSRSSTAVAPPTTSSTPSTASSPTTKVSPAASTPRPSRSTGVETVIMNAEEINTRKEIEQAWLRYWDIYVAFNRVPKEQRPARFGAVAMDPELADLLRTALLGDRAHLQNEGNVGHRVYWGAPVSGKTSVAIGDCVNQSKFRSKNTVTGNLGPVGPDRVNFNGTLQKSPDGHWKVSFLDYREGVPC